MKWSNIIRTLPAGLEVLNTACELATQTKGPKTTGELRALPQRNKICLVLRVGIVDNLPQVNKIIFVPRQGDM